MDKVFKFTDQLVLAKNCHGDNFLFNSKRLGNETNSSSPSFVPTTLNPNDSNSLHHSLCDLKRTPTPNVFAFSEGLNLATNRAKPDKTEFLLFDK